MNKNITLMAADSKPYLRGSGPIQLFSWDDVPGKDNLRLIDFLNREFSIDWIKTAKIERIDEGRSIKASFGSNSIVLILNDEVTHVILKINDIKTENFILKRENGKLNIYSSNIFKGCLGACLCFTNPVVFKEKYSLFIKNYVFFSHRKVIKTFDLNNFFNDNRDAFMSFMKAFIVLLVQSGVFINVVFTTLNTNLLPNGITKYGVGRSPKKMKNSLDFIDELNNCYSYIAAWKTSRKEDCRGIVQLDSFTGGEHTKAWDELCSSHQVNVIPKGDVCNPFISSADLVVGYIDEYLSSKHLHLEESTIRQSIKACFDSIDEKIFRIFYVGHEDLNKIVPIEQKQINLFDYYKRPMIYILKEDILGKKENEYIERSPLWNNLLNFSCDKDSGIKYMGYEEDYKYIKNGDYLIYLGEKGRREAEYLKNLGYDIHIISSNRIKDSG